MRIVFIIVLFVFCIGCTSNGFEKYGKLVAKEMASGKRTDSLFFGLYLGMPIKDFYTYCWDMNKKGIFMDGYNNNYVLYRLDRKELKHPGAMNFYPDFSKDKIYRMRVIYQYDGWAPWNKPLSADSLLPDIIKLYKKWYPAGNDFIQIDDLKRCHLCKGGQQQADYHWQVRRYVRKGRFCRHDSGETNKEIMQQLIITGFRNGAINVSNCAKVLCMLFMCSLTACNQHGQQQQAGKITKTLFQQLDPSQTNIKFSNNLSYDAKFNIYTYRNFYNGGGVAIGDVNNDGLPDIFFTANMLPNRLYLNKGNFQFEDITEKAGIGKIGKWSTGVSMADVNGDGLLDIYVCNSGDIKGDNRQNELYINNGLSSSGTVTFTEKAHEYGLDDKGLSTHAAFFDYDHDGDLDMVLLNNSFKAIGSFNLQQNERSVRDAVGGDKLFRNDGGHFTDVSAAANIYGSVIGFGLGVTVGDVNNDGWQDIYVSNDFFERDYLYINQHDGTFKETLEDEMMSISNASMGADMADINNDGRPDIFVTEMLPEDDASLKTKTTFESWDKYQLDLKHDYYHQFTRNMLQLNNGNNNFSEIGRFAGVCATDWSWGALIADLDNDGKKDIFIANGIYQDLTNEDYIQYISNQRFYKEVVSGQADFKKLIDLIPSHGISNYAYSNNGDWTFTNKAKEWGLDAPGFSNGSAYGDLDNDGDLDLVVNNVNMPCFVYRNESVQQHPENSYLRVVLQGEGKNTFGLGAKVTVHYNNTIAYQEQMPMRGFESTVDCRLNFGLGKTSKIDSVVVQWPDGKENVVRQVHPNQQLTVKQSEGVILAIKPAALVKPFSQLLIRTQVLILSIRRMRSMILTGIG